MRRDPDFHWPIPSGFMQVMAQIRELYDTILRPSGVYLCLESCPRVRYTDFSWCEGESGSDEGDGVDEDSAYPIDGEYKPQWEIESQDSNGECMPSENEVQDSDTYSGL